MGTTSCPSCGQCSTWAARIADLEAQLATALKQRCVAVHYRRLPVNKPRRDEACASLNVQSTAWSASQHAREEEQRLTLLRTQQHMDAGTQSMSWHSFSTDPSAPTRHARRAAATAARGVPA